MPFDALLLGRLVADPDRPFDDYINLEDAGIAIEPWRVQIDMEGPVNETISRMESFPDPDSSTIEGTAVTATGSETYSLPLRCSRWYLVSIVEAFQKAALQLGGSYYMITDLRIIKDYKITPARAAGYVLRTQQTELDSCGVPRPIQPGEASSAESQMGEIVISMRFQCVTIVDQDGTSYATLGDPTVETCFLDWRRGPSEPSEIKTEVKTPSRRIRYQRDIIGGLGLPERFAVELALMWPSDMARIERRPSLLTTPPPIPHPLLWIRKISGCECQAEKDKGEKTGAPVETIPRLPTFHPADLDRVSNIPYSSPTLSISGFEDAIEKGAVSAEAVPELSIPHPEDMNQFENTPYYVPTPSISGIEYPPEEGASEQVASGATLLQLSRVYPTAGGSMTHTPRASTIPPISGSRSRAEGDDKSERTVASVETVPMLSETSEHSTVGAVSGVGRQAGEGGLLPRNLGRPHRFTLADMKREMETTDNPSDVAVGKRGYRRLRMRIPPSRGISGEETRPAHGTEEKRASRWDQLSLKAPRDGNSETRPSEMGSIIALDAESQVLSYPPAPVMRGWEAADRLEVTSSDSELLNAALDVIRRLEARGDFGDLAKSNRSVAVAQEQGPSSHIPSPKGMDRTSLIVVSETAEPEQTSQFLVQAVVMDHSWPIRFSGGKTNITFPFQCRPTVANTAKAWIEGVVREPINWWPLSPRRHPLPEDSVWVEWQCVR